MSRRPTYLYITALALAFAPIGACTEDGTESTKQGEATTDDEQSDDGDEGDEDDEDCADNDADCDGVAATDDCDDSDPSLGASAADQDCDGVPTGDDCNDGDPSMPLADADCDGVATDDDCDDGDAELGLADNDRDCDGLTSDEDCNDDDPTLPTIDDLDCDGIAVHPGGGELVRIPAGTFEMGWRGTESCPANDDAAADGVDPSLLDTHPDLHTVTLTHDFYLGVTEFTYGHMGTLAGVDGPDDAPLPVGRSVAIALLNDMSDQYGFARCYERSADTGDYRAIGDIYACEGYRLPTEAEWEYAARCGGSTEWAGSDNPDLVAFHPGVVEWSDGEQDVAQLTPNACGLYDMSGNMQERVQDGFDPNAYASHASVDPVGPEVGDPGVELDVIRGGSWSSYGFEDSACQTAIHRRNAFSTGLTGFGGNDFVGFRVARTVRY